VTDLFLGLDSSTQGLTGLVIEIEGSRRRVAFTRSFPFDESFPHYGTTKGVLPHDGPRVATSSPLLWAEALDRFFGALRTESALDLTRLRAVSGAAQQHGSVYCNATAAARLAALRWDTPLVEQVGGLLSRQDAPIWMDSSTTAECTDITDAVGGPHALAGLTGSRAFERFTGPQIRKYATHDPRGYAATDRIHLVSSFLASLLIGGHAPVEPGDAAGMNLMDLARRRWADQAVRATAPGLAQKLPAIVEPWSVIGRLSGYWTGRYGLPPAKVVAWTGDNPSSLIGAGVVTPARRVISLGTSDTVFGLIAEPRVDPSGSSHVFGAPTGAYMTLTCFQNGGLARERVRDACGLSWDGFSRILRDTPPGNGGRLMLPWFDPEITPPVREPGVRRYGLDADDASGNVRGVIEAQMMALALHSAWTETRVEAIHATGGGAGNREILQVMADVHDADVYRLEVGESAALGAALRAYHGDAVDAGRAITWEEVVAGIAEPRPETVVRPDPRAVLVYHALKTAYSACEAHALGAGPDPTPLLERLRA
jgi:xylulokinase